MKKCPFCGDKIIFETDTLIMKQEHPRTKELIPMGYRVSCSNCGAVGPKGKTKEEAEKLWNRRSK